MCKLHQVLLFLACLIMQKGQLPLVSGFAIPLRSCNFSRRRSLCSSVIVQMAPNDNGRVCNINSVALTRRRALQATVPTVISFFVSSLGIDPASASLLDEYYYDNKESAVGTSTTATTTVSNKKGEEGIDPTLRASYYYPTAKKRYLPRIQLVSNEIAIITQSMLYDVESIDWDAASKFAETTAENAILPLKLYESSLRGQGLSMSNAYAKAMKADAAVFEQKTRELQKAVKKRSADAALSALTEMNLALTDYRKAGRLTEDIEEIPSVDDIRRMAMRKPTVAIPYK